MTRTGPGTTTDVFSFKRAHLVTATGTPDSSGSDLRLGHICRMNAAFRLGARYNLVAVTRCTRFKRDMPNFLSFEGNAGIFSPT